MITVNTSRHLLALVLDSERENPLFRAPVGKNPEHILDIGTGKGNWAVYVRREPLLFPQ
jgi:ubiquinone/menaquinone biosynthesis C-methylase UbiE